MQSSSRCNKVSNHMVVYTASVASTVKLCDRCHLCAHPLVWKTTVSSTPAPDYTRLVGQGCCLHSCPPRQMASGTVQKLPVQAPRAPKRTPTHEFQGGYSLRQGHSSLQLHRKLRER